MKPALKAIEVSVVPPSSQWESTLHMDLYRTGWAALYGTLRELKLGLPAAVKSFASETGVVIRFAI